MIRKLIYSVGGRGFTFAIISFIVTAMLAQFGSLTWDLWVEYNKWIGGLMLGAKAIEGGASAIAGRGGG